MIGQQVSWLAARAITHKFQRSFFPDLPEKYDATLETDFPTPKQVLGKTHAELREVGLSNRKAEYIHAISVRFADGRLTAERLMQMSDEEIMEELVQIKGIGR